MTICGLIAHYGDEDGGVDRCAALMKLGEPIFKARDVRVRNLSVSEFAAQHDEMSRTKPVRFNTPGVVGRCRACSAVQSGLNLAPIGLARRLLCNAATHGLIGRKPARGEVLSFPEALCHLCEAKTSSGIKSRNVCFGEQDVLRIELPAAPIKVDRWR